MAKETQTIRPKGIPSDEKVGTPTLKQANLLVQFIQDQDNPLIAAKEIVEYLLEEKKKNGKKSVVADFTTPIEWGQVPAKKPKPLSPVKQFISKFSPDSVEKIAAYAAIASLVLQLMNASPQTKIEVNNTFINKVQTIIQLNINPQ